jgi:hypothetical protein
MLENQLPGMEKDALFPGCIVPVQIVSPERISKIRRMNPNLMGPPCMNDAAKKSALFVSAKNEEIRLGGAPFANHGHADPMMRVPPDGKIHHVFSPGNAPRNEGQILFRDPAFPKGAAQPIMSPHVSGHHHKPRGSPIQTVHDPRSLLTVNFTDIGISMEQPVDQSALPVPGSRMHHHPRGLMEHDTVLILMEHLKIHFFGQNLQIFRRGEIHGNLRAGKTLHRRLDGTERIERNRSLAYDLGGIGARNAHRPRHQGVQSFRISLPSENQSFSSPGKLFVL